MSAAATLAYTLIVMNSQGAVQHDSSIKTLHVCQEERSIALYGVTLEEHLQQERAEQLAAEQAAAAWQKAHPPRAPANAAERSLVKGGIDQSDGWCDSDGNGRSMHVVAGGLIQDDQPMCVGGGFSVQNLSAPVNTSAECVIEEPSGDP